MPNENEKLVEIEKTLKDIYKVIRPTKVQMLMEGLWKGIGYLLGLLIGIALIGWVLNILGVIPFLSDFSTEMKDILQNARTK